MRSGAPTRQSGSGSGLRGLRGPRARVWFTVGVFLAVVGVRFLGGSLLAAVGRDRLAVSGTDYQTSYFPAARNFVDGRGLTIKGKTLLTFYPPGFSVYISSWIVLAEALNWDIEGTRYFGESVTVVPLTLLAIFVIWRRLGFQRRGALAAAVLFGLYPPFIWLGVVPDTVPVFTLFLVWALVALERSSCARGLESFLFASLAGVGIGLAMLVRPIALLLPLVMAGVLFVRKRGASRTCGLLLGAVLATGPWIWFASRASHKLVPVSSSGPAAMWFGVTHVPGSALAGHLASGSGSSPARSYGALGRTVLRAAAADPIAAVAFVFLKSVRSWYGLEAGGRAELALAFLNGAALLVCLVGWRRFRATASGPERWLSWDLFVVVGYFWGMTALTSSIARYMVPVMWIPLGYAVLAFVPSWGPAEGGFCQKPRKEPGLGFVE
jgi:hypothetical protein